MLYSESFEFLPYYFYLLNRQVQLDIPTEGELDFYIDAILFFGFSLLNLLSFPNCFFANFILFLT